MTRTHNQAARRTHLPDHQGVMYETEEPPRSPQRPRNQTPLRRYVPVDAMSDTEEEENGYPLDFQAGATTRPPSTTRKAYLAPYTQEPRQQARMQPQHPLPKQRKRLPWPLWFPVALMVMVLGWTVLNALGNFIQTKEDDLTYGNPRTYQTDTNVGHNGRVSHFIVLNNQGEIEVIELQKGHPEATKISVVIVLPTDQATVPATITFQDINGDGKMDALIHYGTMEIPMYNNGTSFQSQPPGTK